MAAHSLPTEAGAAGDLARTLGRLVGPAVQAPDGSHAAVEYLGTGDLLAAARSTLLNTIAEATPQRASALLSEWERALALPVREASTTADRQRVIVARLRAVGGPPTRIARAAAAIVAGAVTLVERPHTDFPADRTRWALRLQVLVVADAWRDPEIRADLDELLDLVLPSHCAWIVQIEETITFGEANTGFDTAGFA